MEAMFDRAIYLSPTRLKDRISMRIYMHELFALPEDWSGNLYTLEKILIEVDEKITIYLTQACIREASESKYLFDMLRLFGRVADVNANIQIRFIQ